jgi:hypothetical protein
MSITTRLVLDRLTIHFIRFRRPPSLPGLAARQFMTIDEMKGHIRALRAEGYVLPRSLQPSARYTTLPAPLCEIPEPPDALNREGQGKRKVVIHPKGWKVGMSG